VYKSSEKKKRTGSNLNHETSDADTKYGYGNEPLLVVESFRLRASRVTSGTRQTASDENVINVGRMKEENSRRSDRLLPIVEIITQIRIINY